MPRLGGATPYTVLTSSMEPEYPPGTLVVVRPVPIEEIGIGDVITYQLESGEPTVVTHRVVGLSTTLGASSRWSPRATRTTSPMRIRSNRSS